MDVEKNRSVVQLTIHEGRKPPGQKMFEAGRLLVDKLSRTQFELRTVSGLVGWIPSLEQKEISQLHNLAVTKSKKAWKNPDCAGQRLSKMDLSPYFAFLRFQPTCSNYMIQAIERFFGVKGVLRGLRDSALPSWYPKRTEPLPDHFSLKTKWRIKIGRSQISRNESGDRNR